MIITPDKLERCVKEVEKKSPKVESPWAVCKESLKADEDPLVYPKEFKMGMKEELEHSDVIGKDKEALKKIVLAHLKEDPKYYTKLKDAFKAEDIGTLTPHYKPPPKKPDTGYKMTPKEQVETKLHLGEETLPKVSEGRPNPKSVMLKGPKTGTPPKTESDLPSERLSAEYDPTKGGKMLAPKKVSACDEVCEDCDKPLSKSLLEKAEEEIGKDKVDAVKNEVVVDKFAEEAGVPTEKTSVNLLKQAEEEMKKPSDSLGEVAKPPGFKAEPK